MQTQAIPREPTREANGPIVPTSQGGMRESLCYQDDVENVQHG